MFEQFYSILQSINTQIINALRQYISKLLKDIPLEVFGELSSGEQNNYPNITLFSPTMPIEKNQVSLTASTGKTILAL